MVPITVVESELAAQFQQVGPASAPAYERVKTIIATGVRSGRWAHGQQLPSEHQLVGALGLSRMTINRALRELTHEGLVVRRAGVGTFVAAPKAASALLQVRNIADDVRRHGHRHRTEVVYAREEPSGAADPELRAAAGPTVFRTLIVHFEDDTPIQLEDRLVNPALRAPLPGARLHPADPPRLLERGGAAHPWRAHRRGGARRRRRAPHCCASAATSRACSSAAAPGPATCW